MLFLAGYGFRTNLGGPRGRAAANRRPRWGVKLAAACIVCRFHVGFPMLAPGVRHAASESHSLKSLLF